jgi:hypothetical protein
VSGASSVPGLPTLKQMRAEDAAAISAAGVPTEAQMRESTAPTPKTPKELADYVYGLTNRPHDYGTCVYAMSLAATAALNHVAHALGVTGFQASCADLDIVRRTRSIKGPFAFVDASKMLYPQYNLRADLERLLVEWRPWAREEARKLLAERGDVPAHTDVMAHWRELAGGAS